MTGSLSDRSHSSSLSRVPLTNGNTSGEGSNSERASSKRPWEKTPFVVNNLEHRHAAQQQMLEVQQKQIKEQQRLIEDLQYLQKQQLLQQQVTMQEMLKKQLDTLDDKPSKTSDTQAQKFGAQNRVPIKPGGKNRIQKHIEHMKKEVLENSELDIDLDTVESGTGPEPPVKMPVTEATTER